MALSRPRHRHRGTAHSRRDSQRPRADPSRKETRLAVGRRWLDHQLARIFSRMGTYGNCSPHMVAMRLELLSFHIAFFSSSPDL